MTHDPTTSKGKGRSDERWVDAGEAVRVVRSGNRILVGSGCAAPQTLLQALVDRGGELDDVNLVHLLTFGVAPYIEPKQENSFRHNAFFIGPNVRSAVQEGRADYTPIFLSEIPGLFSSGQIRIDVAMVMVSPPDAKGYCSLGIHPDIVMTGIEAAQILVAEVNDQMPRVHGDTFVHLSRFDYLVRNSTPLLELPSGDDDPISTRIARHIAPLIPDGATLQLGIGKIPNAVVSLLGDHRDLGLHTEMFSDGVIDLCEKGVITNTRKTIHRGRAVSSFAMGTRRLYDYIDDNPFFEFRRTEYVNAPLNIAQNDRMVSINSALQVDLTGQVCADSMGTRFFSGIGGQVDFIRGAAMSKGGLPVIALPSTAKDDTISRIVPALDSGAGVVTSRGDVHYVVTEFGTAYLHGRSIRERAMALIEIAHPKFREDLRKAAVGFNYVPKHWELPEEATACPSEYEGSRSFQDRSFYVRPLRAADADRLMEFFYSHDEETVYQRYRHLKKDLHRDEALRLCTLDYLRRFAIGVFEGEGKHEHLIAVGRYRLDDLTRFAETALVLHENFRRRGIARFLIEELGRRAKECGFLGLRGWLDEGTEGGPDLHHEMGHVVFRDPDDGSYRFEWRFEVPEPAKISEPVRHAGS